ncbi:MAG: MTH938/NDUFAF3 family protein [Hyphomicrobiaceae bacterium]|nr:MTH938/NDUFAF3 family protein [Hyphomicrobiaceae bacterium]
MSENTPFFPERAPIDAYGDHGFRFAETSHRGSLLILPSGIYGWEPEALADVDEQAFSRVFAEAVEIDFLLFGTGEKRLIPPPEVSRAFVDAGVGLEIMDTGAACRTYNVLLGEARAVAAALLAVE